MNCHPTLYRAGRHGCWASCCCGWLSRTWTSVTGAHLEFGQHLIESEPAVTVATEESTSAPASWVPDLNGFDLRRLSQLPDAALDEARQALLGKFDRPFATVAGSEGS